LPGKNRAVSKRDEGHRSQQKEEKADMIQPKGTQRGEKAFATSERNYVGLDQGKGGLRYPRLGMQGRRPSQFAFWTSEGKPNHISSQEENRRCSHGLARHKRRSSSHAQEENAIQRGRKCIAPDHLKDGRLAKERRLKIGGGS